MEVMVRYERCLGCRSCELACAVVHSAGKNLFAALAEEKKPQRRLFTEQLGGQKFPVLCRHCQDAGCIDACITGAMHRAEDGVVTNVDGRHPCAGCWMCVMSCPYGVITADYFDGKALKCDRACLEEADTPACVAACPSGALVYTSVDSFSRERRLQCATSLAANG